MFSTAYVILPLSAIAPADAIRTSLAPFQRGGRGDVLRVVSLRPLREYWQQPGRQAVEQPLRTWFSVTRNARWTGFADMRRDFPTVDLAHGRYVFDIKGNNCRLICSIDFARHGVLVLWVSTHPGYDALMKNDGRQFKKIYGEMP